MSDKAPPSAGTKVDLGKNAPVKVEAAGPISNESLAAESYNQGGSFRSNPGVRTENVSSEGFSSSGAEKLDSAPNSEYREAARDTTSTSAASYDEATGHSEGKPSHVDTAPTYVNNQYIRDPHGPHGKNLHEGIDDAGARDGLKIALGAEPGTIDDPSRAAEQQFELNKAAKSGVPGGKDSGIRNDTKYNKLNPDESSA